MASGIKAREAATVEDRGVSAEIIQIRDYQNKRDIQRLYEEVMAELVVIAPEVTIYESSLGFIAPEDDKPA